MGFIHDQYRARQGLPPRTSKDPMPPEAGLKRERLGRARQIQSDVEAGWNKADHEVAAADINEVKAIPAPVNKPVEKPKLVPSSGKQPPGQVNNLEDIRLAIKAAGSASKFADMAGVGRSYLSQVLAETKLPSQKLLDAAKKALAKAF